VPRTCPWASSSTVTITGYHDYDLLALPPGEKPAAWKVARQAQ
jgi:ribosomal protein S12 methylthiotransferase